MLQIYVYIVKDLLFFGIVDVKCSLFFLLELNV